jgi:rhamnogalacturonyl hydrolase YesR
MVVRGGRWAMGSLETLLEGVDVKGANGSFICASNFLSIENICQPQQTTSGLHRGVLRNKPFFSYLEVFK